VCDRCEEHRRAEKEISEAIGVIGSKGVSNDDVFKDIKSWVTVNAQLIEVVAFTKRWKDEVFWKSIGAMKTFLSNVFLNAS
jgi:hypothetical protein